MNIMKTYKSILTTVILALVCVSLSSCYFRIGKEQRERIKAAMDSVYCQRDECVTEAADSVTFCDSLTVAE